MRDELWSLRCFAVNMERVLLENAAMAQLIQGTLADRDEMAKRTQDRYNSAGDTTLK